MVLIGQKESVALCDRVTPRVLLRCSHIIGLLAQAAVEQQLGCPMFRYISETTDEERQPCRYLEAVDPVAFALIS